MSKPKVKLKPCTSSDGVHECGIEGDHLYCQCVTCGDTWTNSEVHGREQPAQGEPRCSNCGHPLPCCCDEPNWGVTAPLEGGEPFRHHNGEVNFPNGDRVRWANGWWMADRKGGDTSKHKAPREAEAALTSTATPPSAGEPRTCWECERPSDCLSGEICYGSNKGYPKPDAPTQAGGAREQADKWWNDNSYRFINKEDWWDMGEVLAAYADEIAAPIRKQLRDALLVVAELRQERDALMRHVSEDTITIRKEREARERADSERDQFELLFSDAKARAERAESALREAREAHESTLKLIRNFRAGATSHYNFWSEIDELLALKSGESKEKS